MGLQSYFLTSRASRRRDERTCQHAHIPIQRGLRSLTGLVSRCADIGLAASQCRVANPKTLLVFLPGTPGSWGSLSDIKMQIGL